MLSSSSKLAYIIQLVQYVVHYSYTLFLCACVDFVFNLYAL